MIKDSQQQQTLPGEPLAGLTHARRCRSCDCEGYTYEIEVECVVCGRVLCSYCALRSRDYSCPDCGSPPRF